MKIGINYNNRHHEERKRRGDLVYLRDEIATAQQVAPRNDVIFSNSK